MLLISVDIVSVLQSPSKIYKAKFSSRKRLLYPWMSYPLFYLFRFDSARKCAIMLTSTWQHAQFKTSSSFPFISVSRFKPANLNAFTLQPLGNIVLLPERRNQQSGSWPLFNLLNICFRVQKHFFIFQPNKSVVTLNQDVFNQNEI